MSRYAGGDVSAFETLYRRHELRVWRFLERNVRNRAIADELMQEVWFAVARDAARYQPTARFSTWLFTIAHHRMMDWFRTRRRHASFESQGDHHGEGALEWAADEQPGPLASAVSADQAAALRRAVEDLPDDQRTAFLLQVEGDLDVAEIAAITKSSFETTKSRLRYARTKLRERLQEHL